MTNLGVYYAPEHTIPADIDYIRKLQPPVIRLFDNPDVQQMANIHALAPGAIICPRTWAIDDGSDEDHPSKQVNRINADPVGTAHDHAQQYRAQLDRWKQEAGQRGLQLPADDHIYFNSANEPNQGGELDKIAAYAVAFLDHCTELGLRATAPCLGVGWPDNSGPGTPVNWQAYIDAGLEQAINRGGHWLELHEYFFKTGPQDNWTWWAGRHLQCPLNVPILLGEIGMDNLVADKRWDKEHDNRGWQGNATPDEYADMIQWHISHSDTRVVAALVFITDFRNREWESFNTRGAHQAFLARKDNMVPQAKPPTSTTPPPPANTTTCYVRVASGANIRSTPALAKDNILTAVPYAEPVTVSGYSDDQQWAQVTYQNLSGWMSSPLLSPTPMPAPGPTPQPQPSGDDWSRVWPITLNIEGGLSTDRNDRGNYRPDGTFVGTKYGISANAHPDVDIVNLTKDQALAIYKRDYWDASGANSLPWPLCLLHFDAYVQNEVAAQKFLAASGGDPDLYMAERIEWYSHIADPDWTNFSRGWMRRCATMLREASKP